MNQVESPHAISVAPAPHSASVTHVETSKLLPWLMVCAIFSGFALSMSAMVLYTQSTAYRELERENRLLAQSVDDMRASLIARGIESNGHDHKTED